MSSARYYVLLVAVLGLGWYLISASGEESEIAYQPLNKNNTEDVSPPAGMSVQSNETFAVRLPDKISFAGEPIPLASMDVRERLDRELTVNSYWHSSTILLIKRAHRYFPTIERILRTHNIPEDFKYLALAESGLQNLTSPAGAKGFWQFMTAAAKEQGLIINSEVDERYHLEKSTEAACKYLQKLYDEFGSWTMAAAAYNMGQTGLRKQVERQGESNYFDLILSEETSRYVFRILALKTIHSAQDDFGFNLDVSDLYQPYDYNIVSIDATVSSWPEFCSANGITYRDLKLLNPWLREDKLSNASGRTYEVKVMIK